MTGPEWFTVALAAVACLLIAVVCLPDWRLYLRVPPDDREPELADRTPDKHPCTDHPDGSCITHDTSPLREQQ